MYQLTLFLRRFPLLVRKNGPLQTTVSDSTNVTKAARRKTCAVVETMLDLRDCVHHIQLTIGDITTLEEFKPVS